MPTTSMANIAIPNLDTIQPLISIQLNICYCRFLPKVPLRPNAVGRRNHGAASPSATQLRFSFAPAWINKKEQFLKIRKSVDLLLFKFPTCKRKLRCHRRSYRRRSATWRHPLLRFQLGVWCFGWWVCLASKSVNYWKNRIASSPGIYYYLYYSEALIFLLIEKPLCLADVRWRIDALQRGRRNLVDQIDPVRSVQQVGRWIFYRRHPPPVQIYRRRHWSPFGLYWIKLGAVGYSVCRNNGSCSWSPTSPIHI
jgi:hypothetical protein